MATSSVLGFPRIGAFRELKKATESYWSGKISEAELLEVGKTIRATNWKLQKEAGVQVIASNDFSFYDQVLDLSVALNAVPERYTKFSLTPVDTYFAIGRGLQRAATASSPAVDVVANEMVKFFDSNYHYVRPTFAPSTEFKLVSQKAVDEYLEAKALDIETRPVLFGPVSFLFLGKAEKGHESLEPISLLDKLLPAYADYLKKLAAAGASVVQIDEPALVLDLPEAVVAAVRKAFEYFSKQEGLPKLLLATYFGDVRPNIAALKALPVAGFHHDFVRNPEQLEEVLATIEEGQVLSVGVVDGRNIWKINYASALEIVKKAVEKLGKERVLVATSSSLIHVPVDLKNETTLDETVKSWFSFATQKVSEVVVLTKAINGEDVASSLEENAQLVAARKASSHINDAAVQQRVSNITEADARRQSPFPERVALQKSLLNIPLLPTTTIGSFPQTKDIRLARSKFTAGTISKEEYEQFIKKEIETVIRFQEKIGLDVLVHGEPERNDMVQFFGERLKGFAFTSNGWVQSYGSRYVRPPIVVGDISRPADMSVKEIVYAQSLTEKPVKGMLTGPVTCIRWSFPRNDVSEKQQILQLALALRDEVSALEAAGIRVIQVDEPAVREGLPLRAGAQREDYLDYSARGFRIATSVVENKTQIHSHFCYSDLSPEQIKALDADVVSIEYSKKNDSHYIQNFFTYPNHVGLGLYDIHSPRIPSKEEFVARIQEILKAGYQVEKLWVNPDCGLKTRTWPEVEGQLTNMVDAAKEIRATLA